MIEDLHKRLVEDNRIHLLNKEIMNINNASTISILITQDSIEHIPDPNAEKVIEFLRNEIDKITEEYRQYCHSTMKNSRRW